MNQQIVLASRPTGAPTLADFALREAPVPALADGQIHVAHAYLSLDPYMRGRMNEGKSYAAPQPLGEVMLGGTVGHVVASRAAGFAPGDAVVGMGGWQAHFVGTPAAGMFRPVDTRAIPLEAYLGAVGMPGVTAWYGVERILEPRPGHTVVVSAAAGAVGSVVGQLAKRRGARAVGIAGGPAKCAHVVEALGFDACVDYKAHREPRALAAALKAACPDGIDGDFENVGGAILDAVMARMNPFGRIALCGMIAGYDGAPIPLTAPQLMLVQRLRVQGFIVSEHLDQWPAALADLGALVAGNQLRYHATIADGLARAPAAFLGMLRGDNLGKQLVRVA
ncbi:MAG: NADP-dependent oxidoreductase [Kofleriaceae bacterium]